MLVLTILQDEKLYSRSITHVIMVALRSRCGHYIFALCMVSFFYLFSSPNLSGRILDVLPYFDTWCGLSANLECRPEMCCARLAGNAGPKNSPKSRHLQGTITQLCRAISSQLRHVSTIGKNLLNSNISCTRDGELPTNG